MMHRYARFGAALSVPLTFLLAFTLLITSALLLRHKALDRLQQKSQLSHYTEAKRYLAYAATIDALIQRLPFIKAPPISEKIYGPLLAAGDAAVIHNRAALNLILNSDPNQLKPLIGDETQALVNAMNLQQTIHKIDTIPAETSDALKQEYRDILTKLQQLFSLPPLANGAIFSFYQNGSLVGLPVVAQLKESPATLEDLRSALQKAGGAVQIPATEKDPREYFLTQIEKLRSSSKTLQQNLKSFGIDAANISSMNDSASNSGDAVASAQADLSEKISVTIAGLNPHHLLF